MMAMPYTDSELMAILLSREVRDGEVSACGALSHIPAAALLLERAPAARALPRGAVVAVQTPSGLVEFERRGLDCVWGRLHPGDVQLRLWAMHAKISRQGVCAR